MTAERMRNLLTVAQFSFFKGPHILASVVNEVLKHNPDTCFTWVCASKHHHQARALFDSSIQARITLLPSIPQEALMEVYDRHGIFLFTSLAEGGAKASLEALARGLCVVASNTSGMKDYMTSGVNGLLAPVGDVNAFAEKTGLLLNDLDRSKHLAAAARASSLRYTWQRCAQASVSFYETLLERKGILFAA